MPRILITDAGEATPRCVDARAFIVVAELGGGELQAFSMAYGEPVQIVKLAGGVLFSLRHQMGEEAVELALRSSRRKGPVTDLTP